jgi:uncharacterized protein YqeY
MTIKQQLLEDMKTAMKAHEAERLGVIRFLMAEIKNAEIDGAGSDDASVQKIIASQVKKSQDAVSEFKKGQRDDLVASEEAKIAIMQTYLPAPLSTSELEEIVTQVLAELGEVKNPGQAIGAVMKQVAGRADGNQVSALVNQRLKK